jgi:hypothetical protein
MHGTNGRATRAQHSIPHEIFGDYVLLHGKHDAPTKGAVFSLQVAVDELVHRVLIHKSLL